MSSEFIETLNDADDVGSGEVADMEEELDRSLDDFNPDADIREASFHDDLGLHSDSAASRFNIDGNSFDDRSDSFQYIEPTPKVQAKRKFEGFTNIDGQHFDSRALSGTTDFLVFDETLKSERRDISTPWESFWKGMSASSSFQGPSLPMIGRMEASLSLVSVESERATRPTTLARRRLKAAKLASSDDHLFDLALRKLREIILFCPEDSGAGRTMLDTAGRLVAQDEILQTLRDCLGKKAVSTCAKHVATYHKFARWVIIHGTGRPMAPKESDVYNFLKHLQDDNRGPTAGIAFTKAIGFFDGCFRYLINPVPVFLSTRSLGAARLMAKSKRPLRQAPPLTTDHVYLLEKCIADGDLGHIGVAFGGFVLFCLFASGRFTDTARIREVTMERHEHVCLLKSLAYEYKGSTISERRNKALPHQALAIGLHDRSWGMKWLETRKWLQMDKYNFLMPAISHSTGQFLNRRMTSSEGVDLLQELLCQCGVDEEVALTYTTHSLKRTILHWATCSKIFTYEERQCLGHHVGSKKSMLAYSVEEMTRLQGKVYRMLYSIREGLFDPNLTGAARIHQDNIDLMGDEPADEVDDYAAESEPEESSSDESDVEALDRELHVELPITDHQDLLEEPSLEKEGLPDRLKAECVRHTLSGIIHVKSIDFKLLCGRMHSHNYVDCDMSGKSLSHESVCKQCSDVALR